MQGHDQMRRIMYQQQDGSGSGSSAGVSGASLDSMHTQQLMGSNCNIGAGMPSRPTYGQAALHSHLIHSGISIPVESPLLVNSGNSGMVVGGDNRTHTNGYTNGHSAADLPGSMPMIMTHIDGVMKATKFSSHNGIPNSGDYSNRGSRDDHIDSNSRDRGLQSNGHRDRTGGVAGDRDRSTRDKDRNDRVNDRGGRDRGDRDRRPNGMHDKNSNLSNGSAGNGSITANGGIRDSLVDEFRNTYGKTRQWEIRHLVTHIVAFCQDQHGSRFIQQRLEIANDTDKQLVFEEIIPSALSLMTDVFGNYVIQKLFEYGTPAQCEALAALIMGQSVPLAMQMYGCRVIQKALEYVGTPRLIALVAEFEGQQVLRCVHDQNGNHVIQKCIEIVSRTAKENPDMSEYLSSRIQFIITAFQGRVKELSKHPYGCRVVQRILEHCTNTQKASVLAELRICSAELVQDQYGNYVIQHVMQHGWEEDRAILIREVQSHLLDFSQHKFASNVVEKCLQYANKRDRDEMIWGIINVTFDLNSPVDAKTGHCVLENMVRDPYANYVVQKVIDVSDEKQRAAIIRYVKENIVQLRKYTYGKHIIVRLEKVSNDKF